jgi:DNA-binding transcriptional LysR family regulator
VELKEHNCLVLSQQPIWSFDGPIGRERVKVSGNLECNNGEVIRDAAIAGLGIALKATWDVSTALADGRLCRVLRNYSVASDAAICALYPSRKNVPAKTKAFISFLREHFRLQPALS